MTALHLSSSYGQDEVTYSIKMLEGFQDINLNHIGEHLSVLKVIKAFTILS